MQTLGQLGQVQHLPILYQSQVRWERTLEFRSSSIIQRGDREITQIFLSQNRERCAYIHKRPETLLTSRLN